MRYADELNKFYIEDPYSSSPKVYQYPVDGIDDGALVVVELGPVLKTMSFGLAALTKDNPQWAKCNHEFEPNTTMDFFRCDNCGIRPDTFEAIKCYMEFLESIR